MNKESKENSKNIINEINWVMQNRNITISDLASQTNVSSSTLYGILRGDSSPRLVTLQDICDALGLEVAIIPREDNPSEMTECKISKLPPWKRNFVKNLVDLLEKEEKIE